MDQVAVGAVVLLAFAGYMGYLAGARWGAKAAVGAAAWPLVALLVFLLLAGEGGAGGLAGLIAAALFFVFLVGGLLLAAAYLAGVAVGAWRRRRATAGAPRAYV